jgi:hypothetical protein
MKKIVLLLMSVCACSCLFLENVFAELPHADAPLTYQGVTYDSYISYYNNPWYHNQGRTDWIFKDLVVNSLTYNEQTRQTYVSCSSSGSIYRNNGGSWTVYNYDLCGFNLFLPPYYPDNGVASNFPGISTEPFLGFPLANYTPYTAPVSSVFDHSGTAEYSDSDHQVMAFSGESSNVQTPYTGSTCYPKSDNSAFGSGFNYAGTSGTGDNYYLCYNGHPGIDYPIANNTPVYAVTDGIAHIPSSFPGVSNAQNYNTVEIDHQNGFKTYYLHLNSQNVVEDQQVYKGQTIIGYSGDTGTSGAYHLHFELQKNSIPVDPYGWAGSGADPYTRSTNINLWE